MKTSPELYSAFQNHLLRSCRAALAQALPPKPAVAQHWVASGVLHWVGLFVGVDGFYLAYSLGALKGQPAREGQLHASGAFRLARSVFREVDEAALAKELTQMVPSGANGATQGFLERTVAQLAAARVALALERQPQLLPMQTGPHFRCQLSARADALFEALKTPHLPRYGEEEMRGVIGRMEPLLRGQLTALFGSSEETFLEAVRGMVRA